MDSIEESDDEENLEAIEVNIRYPTNNFAGYPANNFAEYPANNFAGYPANNFTGIRPIGYLFLYNKCVYWIRIHLDPCNFGPPDRPKSRDRTLLT